MDIRDWVYTRKVVIRFVVPVGEWWYKNQHKLLDIGGVVDALDLIQGFEKMEMDSCRMFDVVFDWSHCPVPRYTREELEEKVAEVFSKFLVRVL